MLSAAIPFTGSGSIQVGEERLAGQAQPHSQETLATFRERMEKHPHFRGRSQWIQPQFRQGVLRLSGCLPNYYLKQLVQTVARDLPNVRRVVNRIEVRNSCGSSNSTTVTRSRTLDDEPSHGPRHEPRKAK